MQNVTTQYRDGDVVHSCAGFEVCMSLLARLGWFEYVGGTDEDPECSGTLLFEWGTGGRLYLTDFDGVFELPKPVKHILREVGIVVDGGM